MEHIKTFKFYFLIIFALIGLAITSAAHAQTIYVDTYSNKDKNDLIPDGELIKDEELISNEEIIKDRTNKKEDNPTGTVIKTDKPIIELKGNTRIIVNKNETIYQTN